MFLEPEALRINHTRQTHLAALGLDLEAKRVLEVGAGIGLHTEFFEERGCDVVSTDANPLNVAEMLRRYPHRKIGLLDLDRPIALADLGSFEIVYCYGTLYHLQGPGRRARAARRGVYGSDPGRRPWSCRGIIPSCTASSSRCPPIRVFGASGPGRTRPWVMSALRRRFGHAYAALDQPDFPDFATDWGLIDRTGNLRAVFVGSKYPLRLPTLSALLPIRHRNARPLALASRPGRVNDVGAYRGEASRPAALDDPSLVVHAFEPVPALFKELNRGPENYRVHAMAVSDRDGTASFRINAFTAASSLLPLDEEACSAWIDGHLLIEEREITVPTIELETFMDELGIAKVEFLKVDAQGADFSVVRSAGRRLDNIRSIKLEVATTARQLYRGAADKATVKAFLEGRGFRLVETERQSHDQEENLTFAR